MNLKRVAIELLVIGIIAAPLLAGAQVGTIPNTAPITTLSAAGRSITAIVNFLIMLFWVLVVGFLIWAAVTYLTAQGDEEKIGTAKKRLVYALIAAAIALLATGVQAILTNLLVSGT